MRTLGIILTVVGAIGTLITGIQAAQDSESFSLFGMDIKLMRKAIELDCTTNSQLFFYCTFKLFFFTKIDYMLSRLEERGI